MKKARKILSLALVMLLLLSSAAFSTSAVMNCEIELGESEYAYIEEETVYYQFTPVKDGWYTFFSESYAGHDPYADLYDSDGELIDSSDDFSSEAGNYEFRIVAKLQAGETYTLEVGAFVEETEYCETYISVVETDMPVSAVIVTYPEQTTVIEGFEWESCDLSGLQILYRFADDTTDVWTWHEDDTVNGIPVNEYEEIGEDGTKYTVTFECADTLATIEFDIVENPVESVEYIGDPITLYYMYDGNFAFNDNDDEYYHYNWSLPEDSDFIIHYEDGTSENYDLGENRTGFTPSFYDYQYYEPWSLGENYVVLDFLVAQDHVPVYIVESPVESIELTKEPRKLQYDGYMYPLAYGAEVTVTFKDGTKEVVEFTPENTTYEMDRDENIVSVAECQDFSVKLIYQYEWGNGEFYKFECMGKACPYYGYEFDYDDNFPVKRAELVGYDDNSITFAVTLGNGVTKDITFTDTYIIDGNNYYTDRIVVSEDGVANLYVELDDNFEVPFMRIFGCPVDFESDCIIGDADENGTVNIKDATIIQKHVADFVTLKGVGKAVADVDGNDFVNVKDATAIQKYVAGIETGYPIGKYKY